ncbi:MAG: DUF1738 domain-containing protein, partial [Bacteroidales bacterium]|nr:DUF1738 domain-containing protein [Bacteroidales bacterium]
MAYKKTTQTRAEKTAKQTDQVLNKLITLVNSEGCLPWQKPWKGIDNDCRPFNFDSGKHYNGGNVFLLGMASMGDIPAFAPANKTHKPFKGSKAWYIKKPIMFTTEDKITGKEKTVFGGCTLIPVFHFRDLQNVDVEAIEEKYAPKTDGVAPSFDPIGTCEAVVANMVNPPRIANNGGDRAYYSPVSDSVAMPKPET